MSECRNDYDKFIEEYIYKLSYNDMLYREDFPSLTEGNTEKIMLIIFNHDYDKLLKPLVYKLYKYTDTENLLYCCLNLHDVKLIKSKPKSKEPRDRMLFSLFGSYYDKVENSIVYKQKIDISHELLHLASTRPTRYNTGKKSGFSYIRNNNKYNKGFNEGYTELLDRRIFFNGNYNTNSYRKNVYFMRIIELLYDDPNDMENDYFRADYRSFENHVLRYCSKDEFDRLANIFDKFDFTVSDEEVRCTLEVLSTMAKRLDDDKKLVLSRQYINEYYRKN